MILKNLKLWNFRQFYGENELRFSTDQGENVTLIHGENGVGKTTLLNSILWCLFEHLTPDFEQPKDLICHEAIKENVKSTKVEVTFEHEGQEYSAQRLFVKDKGTTFKVYKIDGGNYQEMPGPNGFINSVLPKDMAPYFFFHGEGVASISEGQESTKFRNAVRKILGFTFAEEAINDLKVVRTDFTKQIGKLSSKANVIKEAAERKAHAEERIDNLNVKLADVLSETKEKSTKIVEIEEKLGSSGNLDAERIKREIGAIEKRLKAFKSNLNELNKERQILVHRYGWSVFGSDLLERGLTFIDESTLEGRIPAPYQDQFVEDLLRRASCICGRPLGQGSEEEAKVKALLDSANTALLNQRVMKARSIAANMKGHAREFLEEVREKDARKLALDRSIGLEETALKEAESELEGIDEERIKKLTEARAILKAQERDLIRNQGAVKSEIDRLGEVMNKAKRDLAVAGANDTAYARLSRIQEGVEEILKRCESRLDSYESSARVTIGSKVNDFLNEFSRKDYTVRVTETFDFHLARTDGKLVAKSKGEKLLLNLAFVSALIEHAEARVNASGEFLVQGTVAPFVVDAPFGELDDTYRKATAEFLPSRVKQIIFLLSSSHWTGTVDQAIRSRVGSEYVLISNRKGAQGEKPVDEIRVNGRKIEQSRYGQAKDHTQLEKVS